jgi:murein DD-endopeptidase MepM/ murein hydrolase activator NlpD
MSSYRARKRGGAMGRGRFVLAGCLGVGLLVWVGLGTFRTGGPARLTLETDRPGIGPKTHVTVSAEADGRGLGTFRLELDLGGETRVLAEHVHQPRSAWALWGPSTRTDRLEADVGSTTIEGLREGQATLRASASRAGTWLLGPGPAVEEQVLPVRLQPPSISPLSGNNHVVQGGSAVVVYRVGERSVRDGVLAGDWWFPGFPLPERGPDARFALFGAPHDLESGDAIQLVAEDDLGNQARVAFLGYYGRHPLHEATLTISDGFMSKVVPEILSHTPELHDRGNLLENYLMINRELRATNASALQEMAATSSPRFLFDRAFLRLPGSAVMSSFADRRTYLYQGKPIDHQDHLGFDLASTRNAPVLASNNGTVAFAGYFGIYGNTVVLDHGYGLMTLYAHLSSIGVERGQSVTRGQQIARTGQTGLAGGDHLHYAVLIGGHPVNPLEWWDAGWIRSRIVSKLGGALSFEG